MPVRRARTSQSDAPPYSSQMEKTMPSLRRPWPPSAKLAFAAELDWSLRRATVEDDLSSSRSDRTMWSKDAGSNVDSKRGVFRFGVPGFEWRRSDDMARGVRAGQH
jgi:hypothetical protein